MSPEGPTLVWTAEKLSKLDCLLWGHPNIVKPPDGEGIDEFFTYHYTYFEGGGVFHEIVT